jgi:hypothetical protein
MGDQWPRGKAELRTFTPLERLCEWLLTSWLFWAVMLAIAVTIGIREAYFPRHIPEAKLERAAPADAKPDTPAK